MIPARLRFSWREPDAARPFQTGISLHSHTLHSRESFRFLPRLAESIAPLRAVIQRASRGKPVAFDQAWWTPPLTPRHALDLESQQIESLGLRPVSLTDHDTIEAPLQLHVLEQCRSVPVSVEWTVPFAGTVFHLGVHNLPESRARELWDAMRTWSDATSVLEVLRAYSSVLIVFNHPLWDETGIGVNAHEGAVAAFLQRNRGLIHALELNGLRTWKENSRVLELAETFGLPVISGGDRHGREPNACINLTRAGSFAAFVAEIREQRSSEILFLNQYRDCRALRIIHLIGDILKDDESHGLGWRDWNDRIFYQTDAGAVLSLKQLWNDGAPAAVRAFVALAQAVHHPPVRTALRSALSKQEVVL